MEWISNLEKDKGQSLPRLKMYYFSNTNTLGPKSKREKRTKNEENLPLFFEEKIHLIRLVRFGKTSNCVNSEHIIHSFVFIRILTDSH